MRSLFLLPLMVWATVACAATPTLDDARRAVVERFFHAYGQGHSEAAMLEWIESPLTRRVSKELTALFLVRCIEVRSVQYLAVTEEAGKARVEVLLDVVNQPRARGRTLDRPERHAVVLRLENGRWRIEWWGTVEDELVRRMEAAKDDLAVEQILAEQPALVNQQLIEALARDYDRSLYLRRLKDVPFVARWLSAIAERIGTAEAWAAAIPIEVEQTRRPGGEAAMLARIGEGVTLAERVEDYDSLSYALNMNAILLMDRDESSIDAMRIYERILRDRDSISRIRSLQLATQNAGACLFAREEYSRSFEVFREAMASADAGELSFCELYLGRIYDRQNDPELAIVHYERGLEARPFPSNEIMLHLGLASSHRALGHRKVASAEIERALTLAGTNFRGLVALALLLKAEEAVTNGDLALAETLTRQAIDKARAVHYVPAEFDALLTLARVQYLGRRYEQALQTAAEVEESSGRADFAGHEVYTALVLAARCHAALGRSNEALQSYREAIARGEKVRQNVMGNERQSRLFFEPYEAAYTELVALLVGRGEVTEALNVAERAKGRVLLAALGQRAGEADDVLPAVDRDRRAQRVAALGGANRELIAARSASHHDERRIAALAASAGRVQISLDDLDAELATHYPRYARVRGEAPPLDASQLASLVSDPQFAFLEYVVQDEATYVFLVTSDGARPRTRVRRIPVRRNELRGAVERYNAQLGARDLTYEESSRDLYRLLVAPFETALASKRVIGIAPDDILWRLPFASLVGSDGRFLIERASLFWVPSLRIYRQFKLHPPASRSEALVAFGDPRSDLVGDRRGAASLARDVDLGPLPDAASEVRRIGRLYASRSRVYTGAGALEWRAKEQMEKASVVHFATHGIVNDRNPMYSQIVLAPGGDEDGVLEAWELMRMDLRVHMAVLSACDTARGRIGAGEGLVGLSWALLAGGCPSTVATLWKVRSDSTAEEMVAFHRHLLADGRSEFHGARALRAAQLELVRRAGTRHPFYWAAFVIIGDPS